MHFFHMLLSLGCSSTCHLSMMNFLKRKMLEFPAHLKSLPKKWDCRSLKTEIWQRLGQKIRQKCGCSISICISWKMVTYYFLCVWLGKVHNSPSPCIAPSGMASVAGDQDYAVLENLINSIEVAYIKILHLWYWLWGPRC